MSDVSSCEEHPLPLSLAWRINDVCNRFELAWQAGTRPRLEDFLGDTSEPERSALLRELIALDIDYRRRTGEDPTADEYRQRFPTFDPPIEGSTALDASSPSDAATDLSPGAPSPTPAGRYQLGDEIGRGGMGVVLQAHDPELGRQIVVKVLLPQHQDDPGTVRRFIEEAQIGGQLQHPGVVPVHERGTLPDGRPYFTMKLVQGSTLADLLAQRSSPGHDLPRFLKVFEQVCQTLAFAHSKGVIHRDLKPSNIMVGAFGEVYVMDWGLAKVLPQEPAPPGWEAGEAQPGSVIETLRSGDAEAETQAGAVLGTYAYMAPEQARGEADQIDRRCDVFGLGAVLCEILTGKPPYAGTGLQVKRAAQAGDLTTAHWRLDDCGADADLVRLAKACLQPRAEDRPPDAGAVAEQVTAYLAGVQERLRQAEVERAAAQAREEEARARAEEARGRAQAEAQARRAEQQARHRTLALAAAVLLLLLLGGGGWWWLERDRQERRDRTMRSVEEPLLQAIGLHADARRMIPNDPASTEAALALWRQALAAVEQAKQGVATGLADEATRLRIETLWGELDQGAKEAAQDREMALRLAEALLLRSNVKDGRFDSDAMLGEYAAAFTWYGIEVLKGEEGEVVASLLRRTIKEQLASALDHWAGYASPEVAARLWRIASRVDADPWRNQVRKALQKQDWRALRNLAASKPVATLPAVTLDLLSAALVTSKQTENIEVAAVLLKEGQRRYPRDFWINHRLAIVIERLDPPQLDEAIRYYTVAVALRWESPGAHYNLGVALKDKGDLDGAIKEYQEALRLQKDYPQAHLNLGYVLHKKGDPDGAIKEYQEALRLKKDDPMAHNNLGAALKDKGDLDGAIKEYQEALRLQKDYPEAHYNLALALRKKGDPQGAIKAFQQALHLKLNFPRAHYNLALALMEKGEVAGAIKEYQEALHLKKDDPETHTDLGIALKARGDLGGAIRAYQEALRLKKDFPRAHYNLALALWAKGDQDGAIKAYQEALRLKKDFPQAHFNLGIALATRGDLDGAIKAYREALRYQKDYPEAYNNLGTVLDDKGDLDGAIAAYREALRLKKNFPRAHYNLGLALETRDDLQGAIKAFQEALRLKKDYPEAHNNLGIALQAKGDLDGAIKEYQEALRLKKDYPRAYYNLGNALMAKGDLQGAIQAFQEALRLKKDYPEAHHDLGTALKANGDLPGAIQAYQAALRLKKDFPLAHNNHGLALLAKGDRDGAIQAFQEALRYKKDYPDAHYNLGIALQAKGDLQGAIKAFQEALRLKKDYPEAHCNLGFTLVQSGQFAEALAALKRGHELGSKKPGWRYPSAEWVKGCQRLVELDRDLPAILTGKSEPTDPAQLMEFARFGAHRKRRFVEVAQLFERCFAKHPAWATRREQVGPRYYAAATAVMAARREGVGADKLDEDGLRRWREQARQWLRAELDAWAVVQKRGDAAELKTLRQAVQYWREDGWLSGVRDAKALAQLPEAERQAWQQLWADVAALLNRAAEQK
jgi:serine/threonine-protein kinase